MNEVQRLISLPRSKDISKKEIRRIRKKIEKPEGVWKLQDNQLEMLVNFVRGEGLVCNAGVGEGKTLVSLVLSLLGDYVRPLLIVSNKGLVEKTIREAFEMYEPHFNIDFRLKIITYNDLSGPNGEKKLFDDAPDLIICDEAQSLGSSTTARTSRMRRYIQKTGCRFVALTATLLKNSQRNLEHLSDWSLREGSPLVRSSVSWGQMNSWALCLDTKRASKNFPNMRDWRYVWPLVEEIGCGKRMKRRPVKEKRRLLREAFCIRLQTTDGFVLSNKMSCHKEIFLSKLVLKENKKIKKALKKLDKKWERPDGKMFTQASEVDQARKQLSLGFYYYWDWPKGKVDWDWMDARSGWTKNLSRALKYSRAPEGKDTNSLVKKNIREGGSFSKDKDLVAAFKEWSKYDDIKPPPVKVTWIDKRGINQVVEYAEKEFGGDCIIWYANTGVQKYLQTLDNVRVYIGGQQPPEKVGKGIVALSIQSHGKGFNLPVWRNNIIVGVPPSASLIEQLIGRTHRPGQFHDVNVCFVMDPYGTYEKCLHKALDLSIGIETMMGQKQRLLKGVWIC